MTPSARGAGGTGRAGLLSSVADSWLLLVLICLCRWGCASRHSVCSLESLDSACAVPVAATREIIMSVCVLRAQTHGGALGTRLLPRPLPRPSVHAEVFDPPRRTELQLLLPRSLLLLRPKRLRRRRRRGHGMRRWRRVAWLAPVAAVSAFPVVSAHDELPEWPDCKVSCNQTRHIYPDSGNRERIWPPCPLERCQNCEDQESVCPRLVQAHGGTGCEDNPAYMLSRCPRSCNACHVASLETRCASLLDRPPALVPGDVNAMFARLGRLGLNTTVLRTDPHIVLVRDIVREDEMDVLRRPHKWERASDTGAADAEGRSTMKFSSNRDTDVHWCAAGCANEPAMTRLFARIGELVGVHPGNGQHTCNIHATYMHMQHTCTCACACACTCTCCTCNGPATAM